jgi:hypothetical protein
MPLPALMNSSLPGRGSGSVNAPSTSPSRTTTPGLAVRTKYGETFPDSTSFGVMLMHPSGRPGSEVIEYARQWWMPLTGMPTRRY